VSAATLPTFSAEHQNFFCRHQPVTKIRDLPLVLWAKAVEEIKTGIEEVFLHDTYVSCGEFI
jgi:hypothetical protein